MKYLDTGVCVVERLSLAHFIVLAAAEKKTFQQQSHIIHKKSSLRSQVH